MSPKYEIIIKTVDWDGEEKKTSIETNFPDDELMAWPPMLRSFVDALKAHGYVFSNEIINIFDNLNNNISKELSGALDEILSKKE